MCILTHFNVSNTMQIILNTPMMTLKFENVSSFDFSKTKITHKKRGFLRLELGFLMKNSRLQLSRTLSCCKALYSEAPINPSQFSSCDFTFADLTGFGLA